MLRFEDVSFKYKGDINSLMYKTSFSVDKGEFVSIIGPSGCGKSTIFRLINALESPDEGKILVEGKNSVSGSCGYMPQNDLLMPWRTVCDNVGLPLEIQGLGKKLSRLRSLEILKEVGLLEYADRYPRDLSGGMRQRASFGRTLLAGSEILLLDEPFSALDYLTKISMQEWLLSQWQNLGKTVVFITHDVEEAILLSGRILIIGENPISRLEEVVVKLPYPRKRAMLERADIQELKEELIEKLRMEAVI
ncbi:MAG: ABC transporter ATP-binding protein [Proteocatella sp.]